MVTSCILANVLSWNNLSAMSETWLLQPQTVHFLMMLTKLYSDTSWLTTDTFYSHTYLIILSFCTVSEKVTQKRHNRTTHLNDNDFLTKMLYKDMYWKNLCCTVTSLFNSYFVRVAFDNFLLKEYMMMTMHNVKSACLKCPLSAAMQTCSLLCHSLIAVSITHWSKPFHSSLMHWRRYSMSLIWFS